MSSGLVIYVTAGEDRHTEVLSQERIRIGPGEECELRLRSSSLPDLHAPGTVIELARTNGHYLVTDFDASLRLLHNGEPIARRNEISDGDEVVFQDSALSLHFFPVRSLPAIIERRQTGHVAPFIEQAALESAATVRRDDAKVFLREFSRELVREINPSTKIILFILLVFLIGGPLYIGFSMYRELRNNRRVAEEQKAALDKMQARVEGTGDQITELQKKGSELLGSLSLAAKVYNEFGGGVCLIYGTYVYVETGSGRPLRYPENRTNEDGVVQQNGEQGVTLTPEGKGELAEFELVGTGFYVGNGYLITNRHVIQPWLVEESTAGFGTTVRAQPRLKKLVAYFPGRPQPMVIKYKAAAQKDDIAVCVFDETELPDGIPVLPLDRDAESVTVGKEVVLIGYPSGPDRIVALLDDSERASVQARYGSSREMLLTYLSDKKRIQPLTTRGSITDLNVRVVAYDAKTAEGGSGAPLFGPSGNVIGVNFAVFTESDASNMAVPIRYAIALLERSGWKAPAGPDNVARDTPPNRE